MAGARKVGIAYRFDLGGRGVSMVLPEKRWSE
jgi:hypothetical protein